MRQLRVEMAEEESWIKIAGEAAQGSEIRERVQATSDLVVIATDTSRASDRPFAMSCCRNSGAAHYCGHTALNYAVCCVAWFSR